MKKIGYFLVFCLGVQLNVYPTVWLSGPDSSNYLGAVGQLVRELLGATDREARSITLGNLNTSRRIRCSSLTDDYKYAIDLRPTSSFSKIYGFFVTLHEVFSLPAVQQISLETKIEKLEIALDAFIRDKEAFDFTFNPEFVGVYHRCLNLVKSGKLAFDSFLDLVDILLTSEGRIGSPDYVVGEPNWVDKYLCNMIETAQAYFDVIDQYILCRRSHGQCSPLELLKLKKECEVGPLNVASKWHIANVLADLIYLAQYFQHEMFGEIFRFIKRVENEGSSVPLKFEKKPKRWLCTCSKVPLSNRILLTAQTATKVVEMYPPTWYPKINYVSWGTGSGLQDALIIAELVRSRYVFGTMTFIDPIFFNPTVVSTSRLGFSRGSDVLHDCEDLFDLFNTMLASNRMFIQRDLMSFLPSDDDEAVLFHDFSQGFKKFPTVLTGIDPDLESSKCNAFIQRFQNQFPQNYAVRAG